MTLPENIDLRTFLTDAVGKAKSVFGQLHSHEKDGAACLPTPASALLSLKLRYRRGLAGMASLTPASVPWGWLAMSVLGMFMSTFMNFRGFTVVFPDKTFAALMMALMLEGFVIGTGVMIKRSNRSALPWLVIMVVLFAGTSVLLSVAGMNVGVTQYQEGRNLPHYEHEDALKAEGTFAAAVSQTEDASLGRITNELSFLAKHSDPSDSKDSGFARDQAQRIQDLNDLKAKWQALDFSGDLAGAKSTDQIWTVLQHEFSVLQPLVAVTNKLTSGQAIPMPAYPTPPDHAAEDAHSGENDGDVTGINSLKHPSLRWLFIIPLALIMDIGPMLVAAGMRALDMDDVDGDEPDGYDPDGPEPGSPEDAPLGLHDEWEERQRRMRRVGDDLRADPCADACDSMIQTQVAAHRAEEAGGLLNLTTQRSFEVYEEEKAVWIDAAERIGIGPEAVQAHLNFSFGRLQERLRNERLLLDGEHDLRIKRRQGEQELRSASDRLALARQITAIQAELDSLSDAHR